MDATASNKQIWISNKQISKSISNNPQINLGPQHPSTHGVLRIIAFVAGETIKWLQLEIGLLHRGTEKLIEYKTYNQSIPYFNRLDYVSLIAQEEIYINNIEKLLNLRISRYGSVVRTIFLEISRILNHLLAVTSNAIDVGAFTPFLLGFEEREKLMSFYEAISGARMHSGFLRLGGISVDVPLYLFDQIYKWLNVFPIKLQDIHTVLTGNRIWRVRLADVGILTKQMINGFSLTGVLLRGSNIKIDLRLIGYEYYSNIRFNVVTGVKGDCLSRYLIRMNEMLESVKIIKQCIKSLKVFIILYNYKKIIKYFQKVSIPNKYEFKTNMESMIH